MSYRKMVKLIEKCKERKRRDLEDNTGGRGSREGE